MAAKMIPLIHGLFSWDGIHPDKPFEAVCQTVEIKESNKEDGSMNWNKISCPKCWNFRMPAKPLGSY